MAAALAIALRLNTTPRATHNTSSSTLIPDARVVRVLSTPIHSLVTDLYWIRMVGVATAARAPWEGKQVIAWGQFLTDLEPQFFWGYAVGGLLGTIDVGEQTYNVDEAAALFEKGIRNIPDDTRLAVYLSFLQFELKHDTRAAAQTLERAARSPTAPRFLAQLATRLYASVGDIDAARAFATAIAEQGDPETKQFFEGRLLEIEQEAVLQKVDQAVARFEARLGRKPTGLEELVREGELQALPMDPLGGSIRLTTEGARASSRERRLRAFAVPKPGGITQ